MHVTTHSGFTPKDVLDFVMRERRSCVSDREWQHRLKGYGYGIRQSAQGRMLTTLLNGIDVCPLDG